MKKKKQTINNLTLSLKKTALIVIKPEVYNNYFEFRLNRAAIALQMSQLAWAQLECKKISAEAQQQQESIDSSLGLLKTYQQAQVRHQR